MSSSLIETEITCANIRPTAKITPSDLNFLLYGTYKGPRKILVLSAYLDESGLHGNAKACVVAGFVGRPDQWEALMPEWTAVLHRYNRSPLHMRELRWGHTSVDDMLLELGPLPRKHGLELASSFMWIDDHTTVVKGKVQEQFSSPYMVLIQESVFELVGYTRSKGERMAIAFERNDTYLPAALEYTRILDQIGLSDVNVSFIAKDSCDCFQPADYLAYQLAQFVIDPGSAKAVTGVSIMGYGASIGKHVDRQRLEQMVQFFRDHGGGL